MKIREEEKDEAILKEIGSRIRATRIRARLKQEELAARCGLSRKSVMRLEAGEGAMRLESFLSVLRQLRVLHAFDVVLPADEISPLEMAELESTRKALPKRVRTKRSCTVRTKRWGDEE